MAHPISSEEVKAAIEGRGAEISQTDLNDLLEAVQEEIEDFWNDLMDSVEKGELELIGEVEDALVFADHTGAFWQSSFDKIVDFANLIGAEEEEVPEMVMAAHHNAAYRLVDYNWSTSNPVVVGKPADFDSALLFVESVVNNLNARGLSPGQAWAYYGVVIRGNTRNRWAERCGYSDHSSVSEAVRKAKNKIKR